MNLSQTCTTEDSRQRARSNPLLAFWRLSVALVVTLALLAPYLVWALLTGQRRRQFRLAQSGTALWARLMTRLTGLKITVKGPQPPAGSLLVANHVSYMDILALSSSVPCFFTPKAEISHWPVIGQIVLLTRHPFIKRIRGRNLLEAIEEVRSRLEAATNVCVFPEGTTTAGDRILPLKPALLLPAMEMGTPVVPVGLRWSSRNPHMTVRDDIAYWGDHIFGPHMWRLMGMHGFEVEVRFGEPLQPGPDTRKDFARHLRAELLRLTGLPDQPPENH